MDGWLGGYSADCDICQPWQPPFCWKPAVCGPLTPPTSCLHTPCYSLSTYCTCTVQRSWYSSTVACPASWRGLLLPRHVKRACQKGVQRMAWLMHTLRYMKAPWLQLAAINYCNYCQSAIMCVIIARTVKVAHGCSHCSLCRCLFDMELSLPTQ